MKVKEQPYVKIETDEAVSNKKRILSCELSLLKIIDRIGNYKSLRKVETKVRLELKKGLKDIKKEVKGIYDILPDIEKPVGISEDDFTEIGINKNRKDKERAKKRGGKRGKKGIKKEEEKAMNIKEQLEDIKKKIEELEK